MKCRDRLTREKIVNVAFGEWEKTHFSSTSLADLARSLEVSKAALYRHFRNKNSLLEKMKETCFSEVSRIQDDFVRKSGSSDLITTVHRFYEIYIPFFLKHPAYFHFIIHLMIREIQNGNAEPDFFLRESAHFSSKMSSAGIEKDLRKISVRFIFSIASFWLFQSLRKKKNWAEDEIRKVTEKGKELVAYGIRNTRGFHIPDTLRITEECAVSGKDLGEPERIFSAIAEVVAEVGMQNATTDKIAKKIGITKSSLYFYFENKDEMLDEMVRRKQRQFLDLFKERKDRYNTPEEKLFCYVATISSFLLNNPTILTVFNWIWLQGIEVKAKPPDPDYIEDLFSFLQSGLKDGTIKELLTIKETVILSSRLAIQEINTGMKKNDTKEAINSRIQTLFLLLLRGIDHLMKKRSVP